MLHMPIIGERNDNTVMPIRDKLLFEGVDIGDD